jgi:hypothetical protein
MHKPGGGLKSNKAVNARAPKTEPKLQAVSLTATSRIGGAVGTHITRHGEVANRTPSLQNGKGYTPVGPTNNLISGPGAGRTVLKSGQQKRY